MDLSALLAYICIMVGSIIAASKGKKYLWILALFSTVIFTIAINNSSDIQFTQPVIQKIMIKTINATHTSEEYTWTTMTYRYYLTSGVLLLLNITSIVLIFYTVHQIIDWLLNRKEGEKQ